jgi:Uri superfamily endonuclease
LPAAKEEVSNYESLAIREESSNLAAAEVPIDLRHTELAQSDSGSYMMLLHLAHQVEIAVGGLGRLKFEPGWYIYCGSAKKGLAKRVARHRRKIGKALHWHIDYLVPHALSIKEIPYIPIETLNAILPRLWAVWAAKRFPASDPRTAAAKATCSVSIPIP